jgi:glycine oxidase
LLATEALPPATLRHTVMTSNFYYWQLPAGPVAGGGSEDDIGFERGVDPQTEQAIRTQLAELFPALADCPTQCCWSGFRPFSEDHLPLLGPVPGVERIFVAAGHFRKGVMLSPATGKVMADLIVDGATTERMDAFSPARIPVMTR